MPAATQAGVFGIGVWSSSGPGPSSGPRSRGGMPSRIQSVSLACPSAICRAGMVERVCSRTVRLFHVELVAVCADLELLLDQGQDAAPESARCRGRS